MSEGRETEVNYLEGFRRALPPGVLEKLDIELIGTGYNTQSLIRLTLNLRERLEKERGRTFDQTWAVFDKDDFPPSDFDNAIHSAAAQDPVVHCAWSNEAFELWFCLHFEYINHAMPRDDYRKKLGRILSEKTGSSFDYTKNSGSMYQLLGEHGDEAKAIRYAKKLQGVHTGTYNFSQQNPSTQVHQLVQALRKLQQDYS